MENKKKLLNKKTTVTTKPIVKVPVAKKEIVKPSKNTLEVIKKEVNKPLPKKNIENKLSSNALENESPNNQLDTKKIEEYLEHKNLSQFSEVKNVLAVIQTLYPQVLFSGYLYNLTLCNQYQQYLVNRTLKNMEYLATSFNTSTNFLKK